MAEDTVYKAFVLPFYQEARKTASAEKSRADRAEAKAVAEKLRADQAEAEAARLAEQLRRLGLPEE
jgi:membrane protein involved in colicin uptake